MALPTWLRQPKWNSIFFSSSHQSMSAIDLKTNSVTWRREFCGRFLRSPLGGEVFPGKLVPMPASRIAVYGEYPRERILWLATNIAAVRHPESKKENGMAN